jgi:hypothetical protein
MTRTTRIWTGLTGLAVWLMAWHVPAAVIFECNFDSASGSTNGSPIQGVVGGSAQLKVTSPGTAVVANSNPLGNGGYLEAYFPSSCLSTSAAQGATLVPASAANSFAALFSTDPISGQRQLEGGFDFLFRGTSDIDTGEELRFLDHDNRSNNGLRIVLAGHGADGRGDLIMEVIGNSNAFGSGVANANRSADSRFQILANQVYHLGVTFATDDTTGVTTAKLFGVEGFNPIDTSATALDDGLLTSFTFNMDESVVTTGFIPGAYNVGILRISPNVDKYQAFDAFRLYDSVPAIFTAVPEPASGSLALLGGLLATGLWFSGIRRLPPVARREPGTPGQSG